MRDLSKKNVKKLSRKTGLNLISAGASKWGHKLYLHTEITKYILEPNGDLFKRIGETSDYSLIKNINT